MILGIGIDIIEVERIRASHERFGERFLNRILLPSEISYCLSYKAPGPFLAVRFAAKEAISKAFGTGIGNHLCQRVSAFGVAGFKSAERTVPQNKFGFFNIFGKHRQSLRAGVPTLVAVLQLARQFSHFFVGRV